MDTQTIEGYRLSPQQQHQWLLQKLSPQLCHAVSLALVLENPIDQPRFCQSFQRVIAAHEILRTVFRQVGSLKLPVQVILPEVNVWLPEKNLSRASAEIWPAELEELYQKFRGRKWDYENGPLVEAQFVRLSSVRIALLLRSSRLCTDRLGLRNTLAQAFREYASVSADDHAEQSLQYADVSEYLNEVLESPHTAAGRQYWLRQQNGMPAPLSPGVPGQNDIAPESAVRWQLDAALAGQLEMLGDSCGVTVADIILASWEVLLSRFFEQEEYVIGAVFSGREQAGLERVPGIFERTLPVPCRIQRGQLFIDFLFAVSGTVKELAKYQDYFLPANPSDSKPETGELPVVFEYEREQSWPAGMPPVTLLKEDSEQHPCQLKLRCNWSSQSPQFELRFQETIFSAHDIAALQDQLNALFMSVVAGASVPVQGLSSLSKKAENFFLNEVNATAAAFSGPQSAHERFRLQASLHPEHRAVVGTNIVLSYRDLDKRSDQLAGLLVQRGVGPEKGVSICMGRCPELLISILAVLKAGAFYIPLDPGYPSERLAFILQDSKASLVLTQKRWVEKIRGASLPFLNVDTNAGWTEGPVETSILKVPLSPANLAYVIYTSGSSGQPKGVMISHGALGNYLSWCEENYDLSMGSGVVVHSAVGFDLTITTLLAPLAAGQCVVLIEDEDATTAMVTMLRRNAGFTLIKTTPAHLLLLSQIMTADQFDNAVRTVVIGGEALLSHHVSQWRAHAPETRLINEYGPTETTVGCSTYEILPNTPSTGPIAIGKPIVNAKLYLLDEEMRHVSFRQTGELYIGGCGLARGYLDRPDLTAERFVPNPFASERGERLYRTGDLARYQADGTLHFLGRNDDQVKIRGYRIETGEIEAVLRQHPAVDNAAIILHEREGQKQMVAYAGVTASGPSLPGELQAFLATKLPEYMVPARMVVLDRLPLTPHGKVDRRALPDPDQQNHIQAKKFIAASNDIEKSLADLWAKALRLDRVSVHDNFFELGGDSIISIQIVNRARQMGLMFTPRQMFYHRTIAELAKVVKMDDARASASDASSAMQAVPTPIQQWFFRQKFFHSNHWSQAILLEANEQLVPALVEQSLREVLLHHDALRFRFAMDGEMKITMAASETNQLLSTLDLTQVPAAQHSEALEKFAFQIQSGLDLAQGALTRIGLIQMDGNVTRLLWVIHHMVVDVVSWGPLREDLETAYLQLKSGKAVELTQPATSFQQWSARLWEHAQTSDVEKELNYWRLLGRRPAAKLPIDFPEGKNLQSSAKIVWASLDIGETKLLVQQVPKIYRTMINDVLLAALLEAYYRWTNSRSMLIDLENHGREELFDDLNVTRTVGWFTCMFPISLELVSPYDTPANLTAVRDQIRSIPNGGLGFGLLRYCNQNSDIHSAMEQLPQPEINFNYLGRSTRNTGDGSFLTHVNGVVGPSHDPASHRPHLLEITGAVDRNSELRMAFVYSSNVHHEDSIRKLASGFADSLRRIIRSSAQASSSEVVDSSLAGMNKRDLDRLLQGLSRGEK